MSSNNDMILYLIYVGISKAHRTRPSSATNTRSALKDGSTKDMSKILSYLKRNKYDDRGQYFLMI